MLLQRPPNRSSVARRRRRPLPRTVGSGHASSRRRAMPRMPAGETCPMATCPRRALAHHQAWEAPPLGPVPPAARADAMAPTRPEGTFRTATRNRRRVRLLRHHRLQAAGAIAAAPGHGSATRPTRRRATSPTAASLLRRLASERQLTSPAVAERRLAFGLTDSPRRADAPLAAAPARCRRRWRPRAPRTPNSGSSRARRWRAACRGNLRPWLPADGSG